MDSWQQHRGLCNARKIGHTFLSLPECVILLILCEAGKEKASPT